MLSVRTTSIKRFVGAGAVADGSTPSGNFSDPEPVVGSEDPACSWTISVVAEVTAFSYP
jgi:hypothetical protein